MGTGKKFHGHRHTKPWASKFTATGIKISPHGHQNSGQCPREFIAFAAGFASVSYQKIVSEKKQLTSLLTQYPQIISYLVYLSLTGYKGIHQSQHTQKNSYCQDYPHNLQKLKHISIPYLYKQRNKGHKCITNNSSKNEPEEKGIHYLPSFLINMHSPIKTKAAFNIKIS